jgi:putative mRNA 3-end processing factor
MVKFKALGGAREVGRSGFLIDDGEKFILDYGIKLNVDASEYPLDPQGPVDAAIISHAHLDHSGYLPHLFSDSDVRSFMTPPTLDLAKMLWADTIKIAKNEGVDPPFSKKDALLAEKYTFPLEYNREFPVSDGASVEFFNAGHILGSSIVKLNLKNSTLVYTGDLRLDDTRLHEGADLSFGGCDFLVVESTYGDREHPDRKKEEKRFVETVQETVDRGGHAVIPAFAVGRSQEIVDVLFEYELEADIYLDGMCQKAARIYLDYPLYLKNHRFLKKALNSVEWVGNSRVRKKALKKPGVIVTTAGMLQGGPVYHYLEHLHGDSNSSLLLTGFQVEGTPGRSLLDTGKIVVGEVETDLKMSLDVFDFSAHASRSELLRLFDKLSPQKIVLVHGDEKVILGFKSELEGKGFSVFAPKQGDEFFL